MQSQGLFLFLYYHTGKDAVVRGKLGGDKGGTGDPGWPKGYSRPHNIMISIENVGKKVEV